MDGLFIHVATGEVTTLEHEVRDDTVELGARVAEALLASAESAEVLDGLGDNVVEELEVDAAGALCMSCQLAACELMSTMDVRLTSRSVLVGLPLASTLT
jgi:hypothetical protein